MAATINSSEGPRPVSLSSPGGDFAKESNEVSGDDGDKKIMSNLSRLLERLKGIGGKWEGEGRSSNLEGDAVEGEESSEVLLSNLEELHSEIVRVQESVEQARQFGKGQELYSEWLEVALKTSPGGTGSGGGSLEKAGDNDHDGRLGHLIALAFNNRGYLKYMEVDFEGAIMDYTKALKYDPNLAQAYYNRGLVTYRLAFFDQSVEDMTHATRLDPHREEFQEGLQKSKEMLGSPNSHNFRLQCNPLEDDAS